LGRPDKLRRAVDSLVGTGLPPEVEIIIGLDAEDTASRGACLTLGKRRGVRVVEARAAVTLGRKVNQLAAKARGDILMMFANDMAVRADDWHERVIAAVDLGSARVFCLDDPLNAGFASFPVLRRDVVDTVGFMAAPWFPFWFTDTWWDEIGELCGEVRPIEVGLEYLDGRGGTMAMRDLKFWAEFFEATRGMRVDAARKLGADEGALARRAAECEAKVRHLRADAFVTQWEANVEGEPTERYQQARKDAEKFLAQIQPERLPGPRVAVCVPSVGQWQARMATCLAGLTAYSALAGIGVGIIGLEGSMISKQRNDIVDMAMRTDADYVFFVDSDMWFPPDALVRLLKREKDIVGATYCKRVPPYETLGRMLGAVPTDAELAQGGLWEAEWLPAGLLLVRMDVFRRMAWPWWHESYRWPGESGCEVVKSFLRANFSDVPSDGVLACLDGTELGLWLDAVWDRDKGGEWRYVSEDIRFMRNARKAGYQIWCDSGLTADSRHIGTQEVTCTLPVPEEEKLAAE